jgi:hypothetical protein
LLAVRAFLEIAFVDMAAVVADGVGILNVK